MGDIIERIKSSQMIRNMMTLSLGTLLAQVIPILISPILGRIYSPDDYGMWGIFSSSALICSIFMTGRYEAAILRPKKDYKAKLLVLLCIFITFGITILLSLGFVIGKICGYFTKIGFEFFIALILYLIFNSLTQIFSYYSNREERYKKIATGSIIRSSVQGASRIVLGIIGINRMGLVYGTVLGVLANAYILIRPFKILKKIIGQFSWKGIKEQGVKYKRFPLLELPSSGLNTLSTNLPLLLLALYFPDEEIGYFSMAVSLMFLPINFITSAQSQVFYKRTCVVGDREIASLTYKIFSVNFFFGVVALSIFELLASKIFSIFIGARWAIAGDYAACFAPWILMVICFSPISTIFLLKDKQNLSFIFNLLLLVSRILAVLIGATILKSMLWSMILYGIVGFINWIIEGYFILKLSSFHFSNSKFSLYLSILFIYIFIWVVKMFFILD